MRPSLSPFWYYALCWYTLAKMTKCVRCFASSYMHFVTCFPRLCWLSQNVRLHVVWSLCLTLILSFVSIFLSILWSWASYLSCPFYWHFEFSVMSAELDCHLSARSLALDWVELELGLNNVPWFNFKSSSLLSPFWSFLVVPCISIFFSFMRKQIWFSCFHSAIDNLMYLVL